MLLSDKLIRQYSTNSLFFDPDLGAMIEPFSEGVSGEGKISYGLTSAGYDLRLDGEILIFKNSYGEPINAKRFADAAYTARMFDRVVYLPGTAVIIPAHSYVLVRSYEYLRIPKDLKGRVVGKSTLARCGILINTTPLEPAWQGHLTIEVANVSPCPNTLFVGEGIAQLEFETLSATPETTYADKKGKYNHQVGVTAAIVV